MELYRTYRPQDFPDVVGNEIAIKTIEKELQNGSHVFLMAGPAGCGKTTLARIIARRVGAGELSIKEINSADNRGIDTAREIMEQMRMNPIDGDAMVWILDEVHMMTSQGQNAMLKALEEVPETVYFILCTTDPQKLIEPLKSRCSVITVKSLTNEEMKYLLKRTARAENVKMASEVYDRICELAQGGGRKGMKLLAKVLYLESDEERLDALEGSAEGEGSQTIELCRALLQNGFGWNKAAQLLKNIDMAEPERVRQAVMGYMNSVLLGGRSNPKAEAAMQAFGEADTYRNGKFAITIAVLDFLSLV